MKDTALQAEDPQFLPSLACQVLLISGKLISVAVRNCTGFMPPTGGLTRAASSMKLSGSAWNSLPKPGSYGPSALGPRQALPSCSIIRSVS